MLQTCYMTYLGVAGWHFKTAVHSLVIDPYFTRMPLRKVLWGRAVSDAGLIEKYLPPTDSILVTHPHYDHIQDVPNAARLSGAQVYASEQGCQLLTVLGMPSEQVIVITAEQAIKRDNIILEMFHAQHRKVMGRIPSHGTLPPRLKPPLRTSAYRMRELFSVLVSVDGMRILVTSGIDAEPAVKADVLLVGADANEKQLRRILEPVQPRLVLPNHWDDMFAAFNAPVAPMRKPAFPLQRIDIAGFAQRVHNILPDTRVIIPERMRAYALHELLMDQ